MVTYTVVINGVSYTPMTVSYQRILIINPADFSVEFRDISSFQAISLGQTVVIWRDSDTVFTGVIEDIQKKFDQNGEYLQVSGREKGARALANTVMKTSDSQYTNILYQFDFKSTPYSGLIVQTSYSTGSILQDICSTAGVGINSLTDPTTLTTVPTIQFQTMTCDRALTQLEAVTLNEARIEYDGTVNFNASVGNLVSLTFTSGSQAISLLNETDITSIFNRIIATSTGLGANQISYVSQSLSSISSYGLYEKVVQAKNIFDPTSLANYANGVLQDYQNPRQVYTIGVVDNYAGRAYDVGDYIVLNDQHTNLSGAYRVMQIDRRFDATNGEQTTLQLARNLQFSWNAMAYAVPSWSDLFSNLQNQIQDMGLYPINSLGSFGLNAIGNVANDAGADNPLAMGFVLISNIATQNSDGSWTVPSVQVSLTGFPFLNNVPAVVFGSLSVTYITSALTTVVSALSNTVTTLSTVANVFTFYPPLFNTITQYGNNNYTIYIGSATGLTLPPVAGAYQYTTYLFEPGLVMAGIPITQFSTYQFTIYDNTLNEIIFNATYYTLPTHIAFQEVNPTRFSSGSFGFESDVIGVSWVAQMQGILQVSDANLLFSIQTVGTSALSSITSLSTGSIFTSSSIFSGYLNGSVSGQLGIRQNFLGGTVSAVNLKITQPGGSVIYYSTAGGYFLLPMVQDLTTHFNTPGTYAIEVHAPHGGEGQVTLNVAFSLFSSPSPFVDGVFVGTDITGFSQQPTQPIQKYYQFNRRQQKIPNLK